MPQWHTLRCYKQELQLGKLGFVLDTVDNDPGTYNNDNDWIDDNNNNDSG